MTLEELVAAPPDLPVAASLGAVGEALPGNVVVQAPPGTGKTTLIPPLVAVALEQNLRVVVTQPRRVAARAAARRIATLLGEPVGKSVGYSVRGDSKVSAGTRIEMVTPGVLVRRLQAEPELPGVGAVILDEVHERQIGSDLALALCVDVQENLRDDLLIVAMSATVEAARTANLLGAQVVDIPGVAYPVDIRWAAPPRGAQALGTFGNGGVGVRREFLAHVANVAITALNENVGDVLVFVPGIREVNDVVAHLAGCEADVLSLHGSLTPKEQDEVLSGSSGGKKRRVIISTAIAESSLTVPGVRVVVDAGLSREPRMDYGRGVGGLVTVMESKAAGIQRAGRSGRIGPGTAYRCMEENTWARLAEQTTPEIRTADLLSFALETAAWGAPRGAGLALLDAAPAPALDAAEETLRSLGAIDDLGATTKLGDKLSRLPLSPRLGRALIEATPQLGPRRAAEICALLEDDLRIPGADLARGWKIAANQSSSWKQQAQRLERIAASFEHPRDANARTDRDEAIGFVVGLAYPERIGRLRKNSTQRYLLAGGIGATLPENSPLEGQKWLAIAQIDQGQGRSDAMIRAAIPTDEEGAIACAPHLINEADRVEMRGGRLRGSSIQYLGAIELGTHPSDQVNPVVAEATVRNLLSRGELLVWSEAATNVRERLAFLRSALGDPWPDVSDQALAERYDEWAGPEIAQLMRGKKLSPVSPAQLDRIMPWPQAAKFKELAPTRIDVPAGRSAQVDYSSGRPIVRLRLQEAFGWKATPAIAGGSAAITLELLSPAGRPLAVTDDLASFWTGAYKQVRAEMRGRYPRHPWPDDPLTAAPTSRAKPRKR